MNVHDSERVAGLLDEAVIGDGLAVRVGLTVDDVKARRRGQLASSRRHTALKTGTLRGPPSPRWSP